MHHSSNSSHGRRWQRWLQYSLVVLLLLCCYPLQTTAQLPPNEDVHVVFLTDCTSYSDWQTLGMVFSWKESGQVGDQCSRGLTCSNLHSTQLSRRALVLDRAFE